MVIDAAAALPGGSGAPLYRTPLPAAAEPAKPNHCPDHQRDAAEEEKEHCHNRPATAAAALSPPEEEEVWYYAWVPPPTSYPCQAGWYCCDICHERRRTDQGKELLIECGHLL